MLKILIAIPSYSNPDVKHALDAIIDKPGIEILCCDNGATQEVKYILNDYQVHGKIKLWHNASNQFVNPVWADFIKHFLTHSDADYLCIMNDDLILQENAFDVLRAHWAQYPNDSIVPTGDEKSEVEVTNCCTPGIFITLNRKQAEMVSPLPTECKLWYGDEHVYTILRAVGHRVVLIPGFTARHGESRTMNALEGKAAIVEQDKVKWREYAEPLMQERIKQLKNGEKTT